MFVLKFIDSGAYFVCMSGDNATMGPKAHAMTFDSVQEANEFREHRVDLWYTIIEKAKEN
jgi:hypothetical protein